MGETDDVPTIVLSLSMCGLGVARVLGQNGVRVIGVARNGREPGIHSRHVKDIWPCEGDDDELVDLLIHRGGQFADRPVLYPITDSCVRSIAGRWDEIKCFYRLGLPEPSVVDSTMSKRGFAEWAGKLDLPIPRTLFIDAPEHLRQAAEEMVYPCVVKPEYQSPRNADPMALKVHRADDADDLVKAYQSFCDVDPRAVVQEWIPGGDGDVHLCLQYYDRQSRPLVSFCGRKIRQWPPLSGTGASLEPIRDKDMEALATRLFTGAGFHGLCSLECKQNPETGAMLMVEATVGRTDFNSAIADINGVPIPYVAYCDLVGLPVPTVARGPHQVRWVRWSADRAAAAHYRKNRQLSLWKWLWSIRPPMRWSIWSVRDPMPCLVALWRAFVYKAQRGVAKLLRRKPAT